MLKSILAVIAAAVIAAALVGLVPPPEAAVAATEIGAPRLMDARFMDTTLVETSLMNTSVASATQAPAALPIPGAQTDQSGCTRAWPYYEQSCLHNSRQPSSKTRVVRIIADDRSVANPALRARR
jgi:hypothetical protein